MRSKEVANDYRYFPEPDLLPVVIDEEYVATLKAQLPELPRDKSERFSQEFGLSTYDAGVLSANRPLADYFETVTKCGDPKIAANWVQVELLGQLNNADLGIEHIAVVCFPPHASLGAERKLQQRRVGDIVGRAVRRGVDVVVFGPVRVVLIAV